MIMARFKEGDWVRAADPWVTAHWNENWAKRSGVTADQDTPFKIAEVCAAGNNICAGSTTSGPYWSDGKLEPWAPRVGERVRFVRDNSDGGAEYGAKGDVVTVSRVYGESVDVRLESLDWTPRAFMKDIEPFTDSPDANVAAPKFKVGDRVIAGASFYGAAKPGAKATVGPRGVFWCDICKDDLVDLVWDRVAGGHMQSDGGYYQRNVEHDTPTPTPLKIEAGKFYMTRDGRKVGPMLKYDHNSWKENGGSKLYRDNGLRYFECDRGPEDLIAEATSSTTAETGTAIVCLIRDGKPLPASAPYVHDDERYASQEMRRLADLHKGDTFGVYRLTATCKQTKPTYDHEWQRLAAGGEKIMAIGALRRLTGLGLKATKDAVEDWLRAA